MKKALPTRQDLTKPIPGSLLHAHPCAHKQRNTYVNLAGLSVPI